mmetsp:Transcript_18743/g.24491  ORF Transcript_18743/g.24491 Transcript_18743/m.24491 type:complete len:338 (-) Transcript_18743:747-1760(-)
MLKTIVLFLLSLPLQIVDSKLGSLTSSFDHETYDRIDFKSQGLFVDEEKACFKLSQSASCMPIVSFGTGSSTSRLNQSLITRLTATWLRDIGYGIDTAWVYQDESSVAKALQVSGKNRSEIFITTKVPCDGLLPATMKAKQNLKLLNVKYVDLLLIHNKCQGKRKLAETWRALEKQHKIGAAKAIGVSNFGVNDMQDLESLLALRKDSIKPAVNQIYMHVGCMPDSQLVEFCRRQGILLEAYSPLGKGGVLGDQTVNEIAQIHSRTPAQIALQYLVQKGHAFTFTSTNKEHMKQSNEVGRIFGSFPLSLNEMRRLDTISIACKTEAISNNILESTYQ